jgi:hypothetical protein
MRSAGVPVEDVAQRGEDLQGEPLGLLGDEAVDMAG